MAERIEIDVQRLYEDLMELCKTPGPTQACVRVSENDPRIDGEFPMERTVKKIVQRINYEEGTDLHVIPHMGNLIVVGGLGEIRVPPGQEEIEKIKKIPVVFGAHLDEITYFVAKEKNDPTTKEIFNLLKKEFDGEIYRVIPICNPPKIVNLEERRVRKGKIEIETKSGEKKKFKVSFIIDRVLNSECKVVGFRSRKFNEDLASGHLFIANMEVSPIEDENKVEKYRYFLINIIRKNEELLEGDMVIQDYGNWKNKEKKGDKISSNVDVWSKALDDRVGCIACIYAVKELAKKGIPAKAILTSSEEGVPEDLSWGRFVRSTYKEFCTDETITIICDGMDGIKLSEFIGRESCLEEALVIPYTSNGKGGGDIGVFSLLRDKIIPKLKEKYGENVVATCTDYSSRSYEVKIMDRWTLIGFVQWSCGVPGDSKAICHNDERVKLAQIVNIIRTLVCIREELINS